MAIRVPSPSPARTDRSASDSVGSSMTELTDVGNSL